MKRPKKSTIAGLSALLLLAALWSIIWSAVTLSSLWTWFVAAPFGVPNLSVPNAFGLMLIARLVYDQEPAVGDPVIGPPVACGCILIAGWVAKTVMG